MITVFFGNRNNGQKYMPYLYDHHFFACLVYSCVFPFFWSFFAVSCIGLASSFHRGSAATHFVFVGAIRRRVRKSGSRQRRKMQMPTPVPPCVVGGHFIIWPLRLRSLRNLHFRANCSIRRDRRSEMIFLCDFNFGWRLAGGNLSETCCRHRIPAIRQPLSDAAHGDQVDKVGGIDSVSYTTLGLTAESLSPTLPPPW